MPTEPKRRSRGVVTHSRLIDEGLRVASQIGLAGMSIGPLAEAVGLRKSSFFTHFPTKESLQVSLIEAAASRIGDTVLIPAAAAPPGVQRLRRVFQLWLRWTKEARLAADVFVVAAAEFDALAEPVRQRLVSLQQVWMQALGGYVQDAMSTGEIHKDTDPQQFAFEMVGLYLTAMWMERILGDALAETRALTSFERLLSAPPLRATSRKPPRSATKKSKR
jgi:AcrR family transcriptional regulator